MPEYHMTLRLTLCLVLFTMGYYGANTCTYEEGTGFTITCNHTVLNNNELLILQVEEAGRNRSIAQCNKTDCSVVYPNDTKASSSSQGNQLIARFRIESASRIRPFNMETRWSCGVTGQMSTVCDKLHVYGVKGTPACNVPQYTGPSKQEIVLNCTIGRSYPPAQCGFAAMHPLSMFSGLPGMIHQSHQVLPGNPTYYRTECFMTFPVLALSPLIVTKAFVQQTSFLGLNNVSEPAVVIPLALPTTDLVDCPKGQVKDGYIKSGTRATCRCVMTTPGYPTGQAYWLTPKRQQVGQPNLSDGSSLLAMHASSQVFQCVGISASGTNLPLYYVPKFANAVDSKLITLTKIEYDTACFGNGHLIGVQCEVPESAIQPYPVFKILLDTTPVTTTFHNGSLEAGVHRYLFLLKPAMPGKFLVTCVVANGLFPELASKTRMEVTVSGSGPIYPFPVMRSLPHSAITQGPSVSGLSRIGDFLYASLTCTADVTTGAGGTAVLRCQGGQNMVPVTGTRDTCEFRVAQKDSTTPALQGYATVWNTNNDTVGPCREGSSQYTCLRISTEINNTVIYFQTLYGPVVKDFTVDNRKSIMTQTGSHVILSCEVDGLPSASPVLQGSGLGQLNETREDNSHVKQLILTDLHCEDSGRYVCRADSGYGAVIAESEAFVDVNVPCSPKLHQQSGNLHFLPNEAGNFTLNIYGYPEPTGYLLKVQNGGDFDVVDRNLYSASYRGLTPPFGEVTIRLGSAATSGNYMMTISNGIGDGLDVKFEVSQQGPVSTASTLLSSSKSEAQGSGSGMSLGTVIGLGVGGFLLVVALGLAIYLRRRYVNGARPRTENDKNVDDGDSHSNIYTNGKVDIYSLTAYANPVAEEGTASRGKDFDDYDRPEDHYDYISPKEPRYYYQNSHRNSTRRNGGAYENHILSDDAHTYSNSNTLRLSTNATGRQVYENTV